MKMFFRSAIAFAAFSLASVAVAAPVSPASVAEVQLSEFTPFGVASDSNIDALGCTVFKDDLLECKSFPDKNSNFKTYTVETRSGPFGGICSVSAYSQIFRGDRNGFQVSKAFDTVHALLTRKYGSATKVVAENGEGSGFAQADQFAAGVAAGVKAFSSEWAGVTGKLPTGTSIKLNVVAVSDEKTFVELNYFFGGPGCLNGEDEALRGL